MRAQFEAQQRQLELVQEQRAELEQRLAVGTAEHVRVKKLEKELADTKRQLQETVAPPAPADVAGEHVVTISQQQLSELQREREALESELELVRNRAAELNETVVEQQRAINEQKTELSTELQQLRRLVEKQADLFADRVEDRKRPAAQGREEPSEATAADPVVTSVMAQFAKLQRDVAQRRRQKQ
jgi:chromosome segregation ATPase